ncbi:DUF1772 domain-containing protein [Arenibaculum pallidiluteum]|uniref:DUF1772 domain-containing protein n=1 Tax=Arenibaculum pallidiluteum TaxID=2812559 RepID=UPI001A956AD3|nr:DUF1772 domain-containing protein [Arenibaculum pallidiluteum]
MTPRIALFLAVLLTALALVPGGAHLAALPNKIGLDRADYFTAQQIYAGWNLFGIVLFAALAANLALALVLRRHGRPSGWALAGGLLVAANLAVFFAWTFPANRATGNWTHQPADWERLRLQWELSHAGAAILMLAALLCVLLAVLEQLPPGQHRRLDR